MLSSLAEGTYKTNNGLETGRGPEKGRNIANRTRGPRTLCQLISRSYLRVEHATITGISKISGNTRRHEKGWSVRNWQLVKKRKDAKKVVPTGEESPGKVKVSSCHVYRPEQQQLLSHIPRAVPAGR